MWPPFHFCDQLRQELRATTPTASPPGQQFRKSYWDYLGESPMEWQWIWWMMSSLILKKTHNMYVTDISENWVFFCFLFRRCWSKKYRKFNSLWYIPVMVACTQQRCEYFKLIFTCLDFFHTHNLKHQHKLTIKTIHNYFGQKG